MDDFIEKRRHSGAHVLAMAVLRLFPETKLGVGPVTKDGFYHDFEPPRRLKWEDVKRIESEMNLIIQEDLPFNQLYTSPQEAFELLMSRGQVYKSELLQDIRDARISFYKTGEEFIDLCRGPHVSSTNQVGAIKLLSISDVYWKNDEDRPQMQRISGVAFGTPQELNQFLSKQEAVQERDFLKLGEELELFLEDEQLLYTPKGAISLDTIEERITFELKELKFGKLGFGNYHQQKGFVEYADKIFKIKNRSYRNLPLRMWGKSKIEGNNAVDIQGKKIYSTNNIHSVSYTTPNDAVSESITNITAAIKSFRYLGIKFTAEVHTADLDLPLLPQLTNLFKEERISQTQVIDATAPAQGAMIKFIAQDDLDREWDLLDIIIRIADVDYVNPEGEYSIGYVIITHYTLEKLIAYFLEQGEGALPFWASPVQATIIPISEHQVKYAAKVAEDLDNGGMRAEVDSRSETMQARIRDAELDKTPIIIILGEKEEKGNAVSVRFRNKQELGMISREKLEETLYEHLNPAA